MLRFLFLCVLATAGFGLFEASHSATAPTVASAQAPGAVTLTLLHHGNANSALLPVNVPGPAGSGLSLPVGGAAAFSTVLGAERDAAREAGNAVITLTSGDSYVPGSTVVCSTDPGNPNFDAVAQAAMGYNVRSFGNQEFDLGPNHLLDFLRSFPIGPGQAFVAANLDFSAVPGLAELVEGEPLQTPMPFSVPKIASSAIYTDPVTGARIGVVGVIFWALPVTTSPAPVSVTTTSLPTTAAAAQAEVDDLTVRGLDKIIVLSHMRSIQDDLALVGLLRGVDAVVAGGSPAYLDAPASEAIPGISPQSAGAYPIAATDAQGRTVYVVSTPGAYQYLGRLDLTFDAAGNVTAVGANESYLRRVIPTSSAATALGITDAVIPDPALVEAIDTPLSACLAALATTSVATSLVPLDVSLEGSRSRETNAGNLIADSLLAAYDRHAADQGLPPRSAANPVIAFQNGGGIRQTSGDTLPRTGVPGPITRLDTLDVLPFANPIVVVRSVTPADLKAAFEVSARARFAPGDTGGGFLQVAGLRVVFDGNAPLGSQVREITLDDGTAIVRAGAVVAGARSVSVVTNRFIAEGGNDYAMLGANPSRAQLPLTDDAAFREYLTSLRTISTTDPRYAPGGQGRITFATAVQPGPAPAPPNTGTGLALPVTRCEACFAIALGFFLLALAAFLYPERRPEQS